MEFEEFYKMMTQDDFDHQIYNVGTGELRPLLPSVGLILRKRQDIWKMWLHHYRGCYEN